MNEDKRYLDSISVQFKSYSLNDSLWIQTSQIVNKISAVNSENKKELLKKSNFIQLKDSLDLYLVQIKDVLFQNDIAPLDYVKPTIDQIIINKRKLELIKSLKQILPKMLLKINNLKFINNTKLATAIVKSMCAQISLGQEIIEDEVKLSQN